MISRFKNFSSGSRLSAQNVLWLSAERTFRVGLGFFVTTFTIRYLGPTRSGVIQSGLAMAAIASCVVELGLDNIVRRQLVRTPEAENALLGSSFVLRMAMLAPCAIGFACFFAQLLTDADGLLCFALATTLLGPALQTFEHWFFATNRIKETAYAQTISLIATALLRTGLVLSSAGIVAFGWANALDILIGGSLIALFYRTHQARREGQWTYDQKVALRLLRDGWPLLATNLAIMVYRRCDVLLVDHFLGESSAGLYAAAVRITEVGYLFPMVVFNAYLPTLTELHHANLPIFRNRLQTLFKVLTWFGIAFACLVSFFSSQIIQRLLGHAFEGAAPALAIYSWTTVFISQNIAQSIWLLLENRQIGGLALAICGATTNLVLNVLLVPRFGLSGGAAAAVAGLFLNLYFFSWIFPQTRGAWSFSWRGFLLLSKSPR